MGISIDRFDTKLKISISIVSSSVANMYIRMYRWPKMLSVNIFSIKSLDAVHPSIFSPSKLRYTVYGQNVLIILSTTVFRVLLTLHATKKIYTYVQYIHYNTGVSHYIHTYIPSGVPLTPQQQCTLG